MSHTQTTGEGWEKEYDRHEMQGYKEGYAKALEEAIKLADGMEIETSKYHAENLYKQGRFDAFCEMSEILLSLRNTPITKEDSTAN